MGLSKKEIIQAVWNKIKGILGTNDISEIGDGTVTGAIASMNSNKADKGNKLSSYGIKDGVRFNSSNDVKDISMQLYVDGNKNKVLQLIVFFNDNTQKVISLSEWT